MTIKFVPLDVWPEGSEDAWFLEPWTDIYDPGTR